WCRSRDAVRATARWRRDRVVAGRPRRREARIRVERVRQICHRLPRLLRERRRPLADDGVHRWRLNWSQTPILLPPPSRLLLSAPPPTGAAVDHAADRLAQARRTEATLEGSLADGADGGSREAFLRSAEPLPPPV